MVFGFTRRIGREKNTPKSNQRVGHRVNLVVEAGAWTQLLSCIDNHDSFRFTTFDGMYWVDPFVAKLVYAPMELRDAIIKHFREHSHWKKGQIKPKSQLHTVVWLHYLNQHWDNDPRFHLFDEKDCWINPWSRQPELSLTRAHLEENKRIFRRKVAVALASDPDSQISGLPNINVLQDWLSDRGLRSRQNPHDDLHETESSQIRQIGTDFLDIDWPAEVPQVKWGQVFQCSIRCYLRRYRPH